MPFKRSIHPIQVYILCLFFYTSMDCHSQGSIEINIRYENYQGKLKNGHTCDIFNFQCDVFCVIRVYESSPQQTQMYLIHEEKTPVIRNTGWLTKRILLSVYPSSSSDQNEVKTYFLDMNFYDDDPFTSSDNIAKVYGTLQFTSVNLPTPVALTSDNPYISVKADARITCRQHYYSTNCNVFCIPLDSVYTCGKNGEKLCAPGRTGPDCIRDYCAAKSCPHPTVCKNLPDKHKAICICQEKYGTGCDACLSNPCKNNGQCQTVEDDEIVCTCSDNWTGELCTTSTERNTSYRHQPSLLKAEYPNKPKCLNGGIIDQNHAHNRCICKHEWTGVRCETMKSNDREVKVEMVLTVCLTFLLLIVLAGFLNYYLKYKRSKKSLEEQLFYQLANRLSAYSTLPPPYSVAKNSEANEALPLKISQESHNNLDEVNHHGSISLPTVSLSNEDTLFDEQKR
ncbi:unnamed protein product [Heterobilharzia americana]|nr:unnamed protein product [Heterobilharzia americana]